MRAATLPILIGKQRLRKARSLLALATLQATTATKAQALKAAKAIETNEYFCPIWFLKRQDNQFLKLKLKYFD